MVHDYLHMYILINVHSAATTPHAAAAATTHKTSAKSAALYIYTHIYTCIKDLHMCMYVYSGSPPRHAATVASLDFRRVDADTLESASSREFLCAASPAGVTGKQNCSVAGSTALIAPY